MCILPKNLKLAREKFSFKFGSRVRLLLSIELEGDPSSLGAGLTTPTVIYSTTDFIVRNVVWVLLKLPTHELLIA